MEIFHFSREGRYHRHRLVASSSSVIRGEKVERRVGGNDVNEIENNLPRDEIFHHPLEMIFDKFEEH